MGFLSVVFICLFHEFSGREWGGIKEVAALLILEEFMCISCSNSSQFERLFFWLLSLSEKKKSVLFVNPFLFFFLLGLDYEYKAVNLLKGEQRDPGKSVTY